MRINLVVLLVSVASVWSMPIYLQLGRKANAPSPRDPNDTPTIIKPRDKAYIPGIDLADIDAKSLRRRGINEAPQSRPSSLGGGRVPRSARTSKPADLYSAPNPAVKLTTGQRFKAWLQHLWSRLASSMRIHKKPRQTTDVTVTEKPHRKSIKNPFLPRKKRLQEDRAQTRKEAASNNKSPSNKNSAKENGPGAKPLHKSQIENWSMKQLNVAKKMIEKQLNKQFKRKQKADRKTGFGSTKTKRPLAVRFEFGGKRT